jgi:hypothetical protein
MSLFIARLGAVGAKSSAVQRIHLPVPIGDGGMDHRAVALPLHHCRSKTFDHHASVFEAVFTLVS